MLQINLVGGLNPDKEPMICGGEISGTYGSGDCYVYRDNSWNETFRLNKNRAYSALSLTPSKEFFISGGIKVLKSQVRVLPY